MNCEHCQEYISAFLDNDLDEKISAGIQAHLAVCADCAKVCEDFAAILDMCHTEETAAAEVLPPNSQALWCRINNIIESEIQPLQAEVKKEEEPKRGFARMWQLSFGQVAAGMIIIGIVSSLLTIVGIRNYSTPSGVDGTDAASQTLFEKVLGKMGLVETPIQARERKIKEQQAAIDYWNKRVEARRAQWDKNLREAFDRNLHEIDQTVAEYTQILQENPQDELSGEMLDSTLNDKMELLREFSDL